MHILINGYYDGPNAIRLAIDTTVFGMNVKNGSFIRNGNSNLGHTFVYPYQEEKVRLLTLTDTITNQILFKKELPETGPIGLFNFVYFDGKELDLEIPKSDPSKNLLGFYIHFSESQEPFDIQFYRKDIVTQQEFRVTIAEDLVPGKWNYIDYDIPNDFKLRVHLQNTRIRFVKANTVDQWAFDNSQSKSELSATPLPIAGEKGLVFPIFFAPNSSNQKHAYLFYFHNRLL
ncbi:hypothetical protein ACFRAE_06020 [Sphingobacterium sp. HJSM2_6]|uniref:hypothetical protein n=1 Tax=Sphingobacterium sp. HJSM2_6 TaxID=3366264 RepID=UPI003BBABF02